jgi:hypothetical protein
MTALQVDPEDLQAAASEISEVVTLLAGFSPTAVADLAVAAHAGSSAVPALLTAVEVWTVYLAELRGSVESSANALRAAADEYVAADWQAAQRVHRRFESFE